MAKVEFFGHGLHFFAPLGLRANVIQLSNSIQEAALAALPAIQNMADAIASLGVSIGDIDLSAFEALGETDDGTD